MLVAGPSGTNDPTPAVEDQLGTTAQDVSAG